jgi:hypothetical protein
MAFSSHCRSLVMAIAVLVLGALASPAAARDEGADGRFEKSTSAHFVLHQDVDIDRRTGLRGSDQFEREVLRVLEAAHKRMRADLGLRPKRKLKVYIHDATLFDQQFAGVFRFPVAGFFGSAIHIRGDVVVTMALTQTLYHELVHAALAAAAPSVVVPAWLNEGLAEWFERRATGRGHLRADQWNALARLWHAGQWIRIEQMSGPNLAGFSPDAVSWAYLESYALAESLARQGGRDGLSRLIREMIRIRDPYRALRQTYGLTPEQLEAQVLAELG